MKKSIFCGGLGLLLIVFWNCATIISGSKQDISVNSEPSGAKVKVTTTGGVEMGQGITPASFSLKKGTEYVVSIEMEGYSYKEVRLGKEFDVYVIGNLLCGGLPGLIVDGLSGAMWKISPDEVYVTLQYAELYDGKTELYALVSWYDESKGGLVNLPINLEKLD